MKTDNLVKKKQDINMDIKKILFTNVSEVLHEELSESIEESTISKISDNLSEKLSKSIGPDELVLLGIREKETAHKEMAVVSVIGADSVGIVADVAVALKENRANIEGMNQSIVSGYFALILTIDISDMTVTIDKLQAKMDKIAENRNLKIYIQHENIFKNMNRL